MFFPYFNPQMIREVYYINPATKEFNKSYMQHLTEFWLSLRKK
jgi:hypothetical protein